MQHAQKSALKPVGTSLCNAACSGSRLCLCGGLETGLQRQLESRVRHTRVLERGRRLFNIGDTFRTVYAVRSGSIKLYTLTDDGEEQVLGFYLPGELVGLESVDRGFHDSCAVTLETSSICELAFEPLERLSGEQPELQRRMNRLYAREIARDQNLLRLLVRKNAEQRMAQFLVNLSGRFAARGFAADEFHLSMSRHDIGNYLGLALETISRLLARLQNLGLIEVNRRHVRILKPEALRVLAGVCATDGNAQRVH